MEQKQRSFETAIKKGEIGEDIVRCYLENRGWIVYYPFTKDRAHYFDMMATFNKDKVVAIDVKTKARLNKWNAQGIDRRHHCEYMAFIEKTKVPFYIIFIDDKNGDVYALDLKNANDGFTPGGANHIIAWYLNTMKFLFNIGEDKINELSKYDQRNYKYNPHNYD